MQHSSKSVTSGFGHELLLHTEAMVNDGLQQNNASAISLSNFLGSLNRSNVTNSFLEDQVSIPSYLLDRLRSIHKKPLELFWIKT